jgi:hypothetical protein
MDIASVWSVMKWVLLVLLAGFVAQFGKSMAQYIMKKTRKVPPTASPAIPPAGLSSSSPPETTMPAVPSAPESASGGDAEKSMPPVMDKKLLKAMIKRKKKEAKAIK